MHNHISDGFVRLGMSGGIAGMVVLAGTGWSAMVNPGFDHGGDGLLGWTVAGTVFNTGQQGVLSDQGSTHSLLWQTSDAGPGTYRLEFDIRTVLGAGGGGGGLPDSAFVSIYSFGNAAVFHPDDYGSFTNVLEVANFDFRGMFAALGVVASASPKGTQYQHLTYEWNHGGGGFAPTFDLTELNFTDGDSLLVVDNVMVSLVPEPSCGWLVAGTCLWVCWQRRMPRGRDRSLT